MGEVVQFERGCYRCENLVRVGKNTYMCNERVHMDDSPVLPIEDGKKSFVDWNVCGGEFYKRATNRYSKMS